jgi:hypothetical protein
VRPDRPRATGAAWLLVVAVLAAGPARAAEPTTGERAIAESLYDRARRQMEEGQVTAACDSFAESQRLDPGTGTLLNLASCHEAAGKLATAWVEFREAIAALRHDKRADRLRYALDHVAAIEPRLAYVTLSVPESAQGHAPVVTLDGRVLGPAAWGVEVPIDAGWHEAVAQFDTGGPWRATIKVRDGQRRRLDVPSQVERAGVRIVDVDDGVPLSSGRASAGFSPPPPNDPPERPGEAGAPGRPSRVAGLVVGGAGILALGVGAYAGWKASDLWSQRNQACPMDACTEEGAARGSRAQSAATVATWTVVGGVVALGAAALLLLWPSSTGPAGKTARAESRDGTLANARLGGAIGADGSARLILEGTF